MKINEIFKSIQGESTFQGIPSVFIRTTGCNLRCRWCDTEYAYDDGRDYTIADLVKIVEKYHCRHVVITGGEPLNQQETPVLVERLINKGLKVIVETNGSVDISVLHPDAFRIVDMKCPGSNMTEEILWQNLDHLSAHDEIKFVVSDYEDYKWAKSVIVKHRLVHICTVSISPVFGQIEPGALAEWIINDNLSVRLQLQIHKYIWGPDARGV